MTTGLFVTFYDDGEPFDRELPPVGPLDHLVLRHRQLVGDRQTVVQGADPGIDIARWLEAELELQRALGEEGGGTKRAHRRVTARDGVYLRFAVFGDVSERDLTPELGPYAVVSVTARAVEGDGQVLATRRPSELAPWDLTSATGEAAGIHKPDIAFRTTGGAYHPKVKALPGRVPIEEPERGPVAERAPAPRITIVADPSPVEAAEPLFREPVSPTPREAYTPPPPPVDEPPALTAADLALIQRMEEQRAEDTLRARIQEDERRRLGVDEEDDSAITWAMRYRQQQSESETPAAEPEREPFDLRGLLWRLRFVLIAVLVVAIAAYAVTFVRSGGISTMPGPQKVQTVGIAQKVSSDDWDVVVNGVQRVPASGTAKPRGVYYVVRLGVTNKRTDGGSLTPGAFALIDANGNEHVAEGTSSDAYFSNSNTNSQFIWPASFGVGKTVNIAIIFDVDPSLGRGNQLSVTGLPRVRFALD